MTFQLEVVMKTCDELFRVYIKLPESFIEVEQVAGLSPLEERAQRGAEKLFRVKGGDFSLALVPAIENLERIPLYTEQGDVLARVDFDLQP
jgi:hypothetical protein